MFSPVIFREYDIRGVYQEQFDEDFAFLLGKSFVTYLSEDLNIKKPTITVGYDARLSSPKLHAFLMEGLMEAGAIVLNLGLITTPISYFSTFFLEEVKGSIMVTGSHNPPGHNGFKISAQKTTLYGPEIQRLKQIIEKKSFIKSSQKGTYKDFNIFDHYIERYKKEFDLMEDIKVVIDCGNGASGIIVRKLYESVGLKPIILFENPDGNFPNHHPDPTVNENLSFLIEAVKEHKANLGIGFDGDADRIGIVDSEGNIIYGDDFMALIAKDILQKNPQKKIIGDVKCSDRLYDYIKKHQGIPIMWKTGHSLIKEKVKEEKAPFGGELSGHFFFADRNYGYDDALYAGLRLIEILFKQKKTINELLYDLPKAYNTPEIRLDTTEEKKRFIVLKLKEIYYEDTDRYKVNFTDGLRISYKDGWALVRSSNTQPVIVLRFEANNIESLQDIRLEIESIVKPLI